MAPPLCGKDEKKMIPPGDVVLEGLQVNHTTINALDRVLRQVRLSGLILPGRGHTLEEAETHILEAIRIIEEYMRPVVAEEAPLLSSSGQIEQNRPRKKKS